MDGNKPLKHWWRCVWLVIIITWFDSEWRLKDERRRKFSLWSVRILHKQPVETLFGKAYQTSSELFETNSTRTLLTRARLGWCNLRWVRIKFGSVAESGLLHHSWKVAYRKVSGVQIPTLPLTEFARGNGLMGKPCRLLGSKSNHCLTDDWAKCEEKTRT